MDKELINLCIKYNQPIPVIFKKSWYNPFLKEYNIDTSAQHPTYEGDDIVRAYTKDKYKNQEIKNS